MRFCPKDHSRLSAGLTGSADVPQRCTGCSGLWIPGSIVTSAIGHVPPTLMAAGVALPGSPHCPDDGKALTAIHYHGVEIDLCAGCGGVWLDQGELAHIEENRHRTTLGDVVAEVASNTDVIPALIDKAGDLAPTEIVTHAADAGGDLVGAVLEFVGEALSGL